MFKTRQLLGVVTFLLMSLSASYAQQISSSEADRLYNIAMSLELKKLDSIKLLSKQIFKISDELDYDLGKVRGNLVGALYSLNKFKLDSAKSLLGDAEKIIASSPAFSESVEAGYVHFYYAQIAFRKMELDNAEQHCSEAQVIFKQTENQLLMGSVYSTMGIIEKLRYNEFKALSHFLRAYELKLASGSDLKHLRTDLEQIGNSYSAMGQHDKALEYLRKAVAIASSVGLKSTLGHLYNAIGKIKSNQQENDSALFYFERTKKIAAELNDPALAGTTAFDLAGLLSTMGRYEESNRLLLPMLNKMHASPTSTAEAIKLTVSTNYLKMRRYDSAFLFARQGYSLTFRNRKSKRQAAFAEILSELFETRGRADSALYYLRIRNVITDSINSVDNQRKLSTLYADIETLSKQKEIELLEKEKALGETQKKFLLWAITFGAITAVLVILAIRLQHHNKQKGMQIEKMRLEKELDLRRKDLHDQALKMIYLNNGLTDVEEGLQKLKAGGDRVEVQQLLSTIHTNKSLEKEWDNFNEYFSGVHSDFYEKIEARFSNLTLSEKRLAGLIKINMTNGEIAGILNIESNSVKMAKYRLKRKFGLAEEEDIQSFFQRL